MAGAPKGNKNSENGKRFRSIIQKRLDELNALQGIVDKAIEQAKEGDSKAREWIADRVDGKAVQHLEANISTHEASLDELDREGEENPSASEG